MRKLSKLALVIMCLVLIQLLPPSLVSADRGMIPVSDVSVYGPGQKAIIAWDGQQEIMILSTDVYASGDSIVLEILPLPSQPSRIEKGDFASFTQIQRLMERHLTPPFWDRIGLTKMGEGEGIEIVFHQKIGAHDITVVKASNMSGFVQWAQDFLGKQGLQANFSLPRLESVIGSYIDEGINYFIFDLIEVSSAQRSIEPIIYQFPTAYLYYPLKISSLALGETEIRLFLLTHQVINNSQLPPGLEVGQYGGRQVQFRLSEEELQSIEPSIADLLGNSAWLTALKYEGDLSGLSGDLWISQSSRTPELVFDYSSGSCTAAEESVASIFPIKGEILFSGVVITPNPCYQLEAIMTTYPSSTPRQIVVDISAQEKPRTICLQCIGSIPFKGKLLHLDPGEYDIRLRYRGKNLAQQRVRIPAYIVSIPIDVPSDKILEVNPGVEDRFTLSGIPLEVSSAMAAVKVTRYNGANTWLNIRVTDTDSEAVLEVNGVSAWARNKLRIKQSQLYVATVAGSARVWLLPDEVGELVRKQDIHSITLKTIDYKPIYEVSGVAKGKLLGLVSIDVAISSSIDAQSGEVIKEKMPFWGFLCTY